MFVLKAFAPGLGIVLSLIIVTFVYAYLQPGPPKEKAISISILLISPYYWILLIPGM